MDSTENYFKIQAGLSSLEVKYHEWEWEEELRKLDLEDVGLGEISEAFIHILVITIFSSDNQFCWSWSIPWHFCV